MSAQRYDNPIARARMADDRCPECGNAANTHLDSPAFWLPRNCDLMPRGVTERIEQYRTDAKEDAS